MTENTSSTNLISGPSDVEFRKVLAAAVDVRLKGSISGVDVTEALIEIKEKYGFEQWREYLKSRFNSYRENKYNWLVKGYEDHSINRPNREWFMIPSGDLKKLNRKFMKRDSLSIGFEFNEDWSRIEGFKAIVHGDDIVGGPFQQFIWILSMPFLIIGLMVFRIKKWSRSSGHG
ncbi:hypothetical protein [Rhodomicrobium lacus]|uniref:hypothetical protein n=1 Tax=Rhodomicrobium lacus TaxID=2498452 RepID=UPI0026E39699|nr:hypothetical protein [Rhodomicrobium lacus]WKW49782.1 hypothetical protein QMO75_10775 [Rhodomicrobium lacus]